MQTFLQILGVGIIIVQRQNHTLNYFRNIPVETELLPVSFVLELEADVFAQFLW